MMQPTPGSRIKELREEKFWSMKELAKRVYVTPSQISRIQNNSLGVITLAEDLDIDSVTEIFIGTEFVSKAEVRNSTMTCTTSSACECKSVKSCVDGIRAGIYNGNAQVHLLEKPIV